MKVVQINIFTFDELSDGAKAMVQAEYNLMYGTPKTIDQNTEYSKRIREWYFSENGTFYNTIKNVDED